MWHLGKVHLLVENIAVCVEIRKSRDGQGNQIGTRQTHPVHGVKIKTPSEFQYDAIPPGSVTGLELVFIHFSLNVYTWPR